MADQPLPIDGGTLTLYRGDTRVWSDVIEENTGTDDAPVWSPFDLTGWTVTSQIRADLDREADPIEVTVDITDAVGGVVERTLSAANASLLGPDKSVAYMDVQMTRTSDGFARTYKKWKVKVGGDVTND